jgi:DNA-directed RNA polymerase specialized sigma24 family protein
VILSIPELAAALAELPTDTRTMVESHFLDGDSTFRIQRQRQMKRREVEAAIGAAVVTMRTALHGRGVLGMADVI